MACFDTLEEAVLGLAATWRYQQFRRRHPPEILACRPPAASGPFPCRRAGAGGGGGPGAPEALRHPPGAQPPGPGRDAAAAAGAGDWATRWCSRSSRRNGCTNPTWAGCASTSPTEAELQAGLPGTGGSVSPPHPRRDPPGHPGAKAGAGGGTAPGAQAGPAVRAGAGGRRRGHLYGSPEGHGPGPRAGDPGAGRRDAALAENLTPSWPAPGARRGSTWRP